MGWDLGMNRTRMHAGCPPHLPLSRNLRRLLHTLDRMGAPCQAPTSTQMPLLTNSHRRGRALQWARRWVRVERDEEACAAPNRMMRLIKSIYTLVSLSPPPTPPPPPLSRSLALALALALARSLSLSLSLSPSLCREREGGREREVH